MSVNPIREGFHTITPALITKNAPEVIDFVQKAFGATIIDQMVAPDGTVLHAELQIGDSRFMMGEANEQFPAMPTRWYLYVPDCDALYNAAIAAGATSLNAPKTEFYGDRSAGVVDAAGNQWMMSTHVEDVSEEEMMRRAKELGYM